MLIARYTANKSGVVPTFNDGYQYTINETVSDGIYTVEINSDTDFTSCSFDNKNSKNNLLTVEYLKVTSSVTTMSGMFNNCSKLTQLDVSNWVTSQVTNMDYMFFGCSLLTQLDLSNFDTSNVTSMNAMFQYCSQLTQLDVGNFNTSNVTSMDGVFKGCSQLTQVDVSNWVTNKIPSIRDMFSYCSQLTQLDVSTWVTKNVTDMRFTFEGCSKLTQLDLSNWNTSNVTNTYGMFDGCSSLAQLDISNFDTSSITNTYNMFASCTSLNNVIATNVSTSTLSKLITELPTRTSDSYGTIRAKNITNEITSSANAKYWNVTDKMLIARYTANKSGVVPTFNEGYQYTIDETVNDGIYTVEISSNTDFTSCSFNEKSNLLTVEYLKVTSSVTTMNKMFQSCSQLTQLDVSNWDTSSVTRMAYLFQNCSKLTHLDVSNWDSSNVTRMDSMFQDCSQLTQLDVSNWDTSNVTNMTYMFKNCSKLTQLDLSNWNTSKVQYMYGMFYFCSQLTQLDLSNWDTSSVTDMGDMFSYCSLLDKIIATNVSTSTLSKLITVLPTRTTDSYGTIKVANTTDEITSSANAKYWNIKAPMLVARYTTNTSGVLPTFNDDYQYTINETVSDGIYTVELRSDSDFTSCSFDGCSNLLTIEYLKVTDKVTSMYSLFHNCSSLTQLDVSNWDTKNVTNMNNMFGSCSKLTQLDTSNFDTSQITSMASMFYNCKSLTSLDVSNWNMDEVTVMNYMFNGCSSLNEIIATNVSTSTLDKLIAKIPTRTSDSYGTIKVANTTDEMISYANDKYWNISVIMLIARYTANVSDIVPTFNSGYQYEVNETVNNGIYTVEIKSEDDFTSCSFKNKSNLLTVEYLKVTNNATKMSSMFYKCTQLTQLDVSNWDTSNVTSMNNMFQNCSQLTQLDTSKWDTNSVTNMECMFQGCYQLTTIGDISNWDTSNVTDMGIMFDNCSKLTQLDVSKWDTSKVKDMYAMFNGCSSLTQLDVSNWDTGQVKNTSNMFFDCSQLTQLDLSNWDTNKITDMSYMFAYCSQLTQLDVSNFNTSNVTAISSIFSNCTSLNNVIATNVSVSTLSKLIGQLPSKTSDSYGTIKAMNSTTETISSANAKYWNIKAPMLVARYTTNTSGVLPTFNDGYQYTINETVSDGIYTVELRSDSDFTSCSFNEKSNLLTVEYLKVTSSVTTMNKMFRYCSQLTQVDVSNFDTSNVTNMASMFYSCSSLTQLDVSNWVTSKVTTMTYMFCDCNKLTQLDVSNWVTSSVTGMNNMFQNCSQLTQLDTSNWDIGKVQYMNNMFDNCSSLTQLNVNNWNTSNVKETSYMFQKCSSLTQLDLSNWVTNNVTRMEYMFRGCSKLTQLDVSNWGTNNVTTMSYMFQNCTQLTQLDVSNWDTSSVTGTINMFDNCQGLQKILLCNSSTSTVNKIIEQLPSRVDKSLGKLYTKNISQLNTNDKNWEYFDKYYLTKYTFTKVVNGETIDLLPIFNNDIVYEKVDVDNGDTITRTLNIRLEDWEEFKKLTSMRFGDNFDGDASNGALSLLSIELLDVSTLTSCAYMFRGCQNVSRIDTTNFNTSSVKDMYSMFMDCTQLTQLDVSNWDTSNVTNMRNMFNTCSKLTQLDVSNWDTGNVTNMSVMFQSCSKLTQLDISNWDTSKAQYMNSMFQSCSQLTQLDVSKWDTSKVTNMGNMFPNCSKLTQLDLSNWDTSKVTSMDYMFYNCAQLTAIGDVSNWDTSSVTVIYSMFRNCSKLTQLDLSNWDTGSVTTMHSMFNGCTQLTQLDVSNFDTSSVKDMNHMFFDCSKLTQLDVSNWDTSNVTNMESMFQNCSQLTQLDVSKWDTKNVKNMFSMFHTCSKLTQLDVSNWDTSQVTNMYAMFQDCSRLTTIGDVSNWDTSKVTTMENMFRNCSQLAQLDLSNWDTSSVTSMNGMFYDCSKITELNVDNWKTENVEDMASIFYNCKEVAYLNLGGWDTRKVRDMDNMFGGCTVLSYLDLSNLKIDNVSNMNNMFEGCDALSFIGLVYSDISVLNKLPTFETMTLYVGGKIDRSQYTGVSTLKEYIEKEVKITSPIDLRSNGDVADRLYWNDEDKHYYIEQWIDSLTGEVLETPNIIATGITTPIEIKQFTNVFTIDVKNLTPSYLNITTPHFYIPDDYEYKEEEEVEYFKQSFELRFPDEDDVGSDWGFAHVEGDHSMGLKRVIDWVDNCDDKTFVREFDNYFHRQYTLRYFLLVITLGMVDNLGKNMMLDTFDHKIWMPRFYDMDTICSYDNSGQIKFDVDIEMAQGYWNTSASRLWTRIRDLMHNDLVATYKDMRANGMSYESFMKYFYDEQIAQIPQKYYNMDADVKYLPFADAYIGKAHGDGYEHLKRWLKRRLIFTDTLYDYQPSYINDVLTIRANTTEKMTLEIETYTPVYQHLSWYNGQMDKQKIDGKTSVTFEGFAQASTDQEILIYGGSNIKSIKGISTCNPSQLLIGSATRLVELEARDCPMLSDINSMGANLLPHTYLNKLDLSGCTALSGNLNIQNSPLLIHLDVSRTGLTGINLPNAVKNMERMVFSECPNITAINMPNLYMPRLNGCKDMFKGCTNLKTVNLKGWVTPNITETNDMFSNCSSLTTLNLSNWDVSSITSANNMFNGCSSIIDVTPPKNLLISHDISSMISLSGNEVLEWVDALSLIETNQIIILGSTLIVLLSEEDILRIINKGWSVG